MDHGSLAFPRTRRFLTPSWARSLFDLPWADLRWRRQAGAGQDGARMALPVLEVSHLAKSYGGFRAVNDLSFAIAPGEVFGFLGANGAGKTTTLRMILGLMPSDAGVVRLFGQPWSRPLLRRIGYLPEERGLYRRMRAAEAVAFYARLKGLDGRTARRRAVDQ